MTELEFKSLDISNNALKVWARKGKLPTKLKIFNWGKNETVKGPVFLNDKTVKVFEAFQEKTGRDRDLAIDFDHCTVEGSPAFVKGKVKDIAGYGDPELVPGNGTLFE